MPPVPGQTKGKVKRFIDYLRRSFFVPVTRRYELGKPLYRHTLNAELAVWLERTANAREHGTTGLVPAEQLVMELPALQPLPPAYLSGPGRVCGPAGQHRALLQNGYSTRSP